MASRTTAAALGCAPRLRADSAPGSESSDGVGAVPGTEDEAELDGGVCPVWPGSGCGIGSSRGWTPAVRGLSGHGCCGHGCALSCGRAAPASGAAA
eukprot:5403062-Alexandrium_andersonii.AAC.1